MSSTDSDHGSFRQSILEFTAAFEALIHVRKRGGSRAEQARLRRRMYRIRKNHFNSDGGHGLADALRAGVMHALRRRQ